MIATSPLWRSAPFGVAMTLLGVVYFGAQFSAGRLVAVDAQSALAALVFGFPAAAFLWRSWQARLAARQADYLVRHDGTTGLLNRASFTERLGAVLERRRAGADLALVFLDVDGLEAINDMHGQQAGDRFLKHVARCLTRICGAGDLAARLGGDRFAIAFSGRDAAAASKLAGELMSAVSRPIVVRGRPLTGSVSCGIHAVEDGATEIADAMYKADVALCQAKVDGPFASAVHGHVEAAMRERRQLELLIRSAVECESFELHYQPLLAAEDGDCAGFEALLRLRDFEGGFIPASRFIPALEQKGLIAGVGKWVVGEAARLAATWPRHLFVAVNLSVRQFEDGELVGQVREALAASGLQPERLELEVTENLLMEKTALIGPQLKELRALGVSIALDDFGTGSSSLGHLWQFGLDRLKIAPALVAALEDDDDGQAREILDTIIMLGHKLDMRVTAEGIETARQADILSALACDRFQGHFCGKPGPAAEIAPWLATRLRDKLIPKRRTLRERAPVAEAVA